MKKNEVAFANCVYRRDGGAYIQQNILLVEVGSLLATVIFWRQAEYHQLYVF